ncbi:MAG: sugar phosphate isomerase/epimerase [Armatimonadota bacterium]|nr:sugar phosphate isomerase/epimerase [Armatimonadota bacterium]
MERTFGLNGATTGDRADLATDIRVAAAAGYQVVEVRDAKIERYLAAGGTLGALRGLLRSAGVGVLSVNALEDSTLRTGEAFVPVLARCRTLCEWARALDCPYVVAVPSVLPPGGVAEGEVRARTVEALRRLGRVAADAGVRLGFEFLGFSTCSVNTVRAARRIVEEVGDPAVGLVIDAFHFYVGGSQPEDLDGLDASRLFIVHLDDAEPGEPASLTDAQRLLPGEGVIPLKALVARLEQLGYRGAYSLELFRPEYWAQDPAEVARRGLDSLRRLFG